MASEPDTQSCEVGRRFPFMRLVPELQVHVFQALPNLWTLIALRQTCHGLNDLYLAHEKGIMRAMRDSLTDPFADYYTFLTTLHLPASAVKHPPPGGWPSINTSSCRHFGKTAFVVEVLAGLAYIEQLPKNRFEHQIDAYCNVLDYSKRTPEDFGGLGIKSGEIAYAMRDAGQTPRHKVVIAEACGNGGIVLFLDTMSGEIHEEVVWSGPGDRLPVAEYLAKKKRTLMGCREVLVPGVLDNGGWFPVEEEKEPYDAAKMESEGEPSDPDQNFGFGVGDLQWVRHLYRKFGWPDKGWRREEGLEAIRQFAERRIEERQAAERLDQEIWQSPSPER